MLGALSDAFPDARLVVFSMHGMGPNAADVAGTLLARALKEKHARAMNRTFTLLGLVHPPTDIGAVRHAINDGDAKVRSRAIEYLDNLLEGDVRRRVMLLVDEMPNYNVLGPNRLGGSPVTLHLVVPDVDAAVARAEQAGATVTMPVADQFWGDRYGVVKDPFGHNWSIATPKPNAPRTEAELKEAAKAVFG